MNYSDVLNNARQCIGKYCKACPVCNGVACKNQIPGPGAKGVGDTAIRNYNKWADIRVNMDTLCENGTPDTHVELFGQSFQYPFFAGPVGAVSLHYSDAYTDMTYNDVLVRACAENGITAFTGDGTNPDVMTMATKAIGAANGCGVPTIKPWNIDTIKAKMEQAKESGCFAVAMDVDAAGLPFLKNMTPPAGSKSVAELKEIVALAGKPFIVKGLYQVAGGGQALKDRLDEIFQEIDEAIENGANFLVLSDRDSNYAWGPIPSLLLTSAVQHHLLRRHTRTQISMVVEAGDVREIHHVALLIAYGAAAVNPYLAFESVEDLSRKGYLKVDAETAVKNLTRALSTGVLKIMAKMGVSTIMSYRGAQLFEAVGLNKDVIDEYFTGTTSRVGGVGLDELAEEVASRHRVAYPTQWTARPHRNLRTGGAVAAVDRIDPERLRICGIGSDTESGKYADKHDKRQEQGNCFFHGIISPSSKNLHTKRAG